ncbi:UNVERIFIED_CONTAM: hypothetical protein PYX00_006499 [Menopon gallinae]|uniref:Uncharacterized protein n=1 Tax=Menopon gallinae TaxID=328185 RepID=A0AAW2HVD6_9NEOP
MSKYGYHDVFYSRARELVYKQVKWTATEKSFRSTTKTEDCTLFDCLTKTVMKSAVGAVIGVHPDDRETILEYTDTPIYFTSDPEGLIQKIRNVQGILTVANAIHFLTDLRLMDCNISEIDRSLRTLENLKFLNLSGNRIHGLHGEYLPRHLNFLELFKNNISDIQSLCQGTPKTLIHIGLARNKITNLSNLNALGKLCQCTSLDLGDNDIIHLLPVLSSLSRLHRLRCLNLQGNPCAMSYSYARAVKEMCPKIRYLDYIPLKVGKSTDEIITEDGCLFLPFLRIIWTGKTGKTKLGVLCGGGHSTFRPEEENTCNQKGSSEE